MSDNLRYQWDMQSPDSRQRAGKNSIRRLALLTFVLVYMFKKMLRLQAKQKQTPKYGFHYTIGDANYSSSDWKDVRLIRLRNINLFIVDRFSAAREVIVCLRRASERGVDRPIRTLQGVPEGILRAKRGHVGIVGRARHDEATVRVRDGLNISPSRWGKKVRGYFMHSLAARCF